MTLRFSVVLLNSVTQKSMQSFSYMKHIAVTARDFNWLGLELVTIFLAFYQPNVITNKTEKYLLVFPRKISKFW